MKVKEIDIAGRRIGRGHPPFVIAEVGINHDGDVSRAEALVDVAVDAGADCIKFQCHITEAEMIPTNMRPGEISDERLWDIIRRCELTEDEERRIKKRCEEKGILYLSTPFSREAADRLNDIGVAAFKVGSGECNNIPLLEYVAGMGKPIILSTGMNDLESIRRSVDAVERHGCPLMLMHCTSMYPTPYEKVRLGALRELEDNFRVPVGLSDHSLGIYTCLGAVALGAAAVEKHFTVSREWSGPDVPISIEPDELRELVRGARAIFLASGGHKTVLPEEKPVMDFAYASVVTIAPVRAGETFTLENTWVKRPGTGPILAKDLNMVLGKKAARNLKEDCQISHDDIRD